MAVVLLIAVFIRLVYKDLANKEAIKHVENLLAVNDSEMRALEGDYFQFPDGAEHLPKDHLYAADIDIFGHASLFQFINRTNSEMGAECLSGWLLQPAEPSVIVARQEAVKELSAKMQWRQELQAVGRETSLKRSTLTRLRSWVNEPTLFLQFKPWAWLRIVLPVISVGVLVGNIAGVIPLNILYLSLFLFAVLAYQLNKLIAPLHDRLSKMVEELETLSRSVALAEDEGFETALLQSLKNNYVVKDHKASLVIGEVKQLLERLDIRYNVVISAPLNLLLLWNLQQVLELEKWKKAHAADIEKWFDTLAVLESLSSLANVHFNQPGWCFPQLADKYFSIEAEELGHPLITESKRVNNYINIKQHAQLMLVTGSNMAGKSTYLRSVGINVVLAMAGAPVCAKSFRISPVQLVSSMRIADNLEESTSTFYAELKKLKTVIDKVNRREHVFILLDEILRGTNSLDRHTGSVALIRQLIRQETAGIIATHDLALADIKQEFPGNILNFHFDAQIEKEELYFDYKLKPGVCKSLNASILMKKIGIEL